MEWRGADVPGLKQHGAEPAKAESAWGAPNLNQYGAQTGEPAWCSLHSGSKLLNQIGRPLTVPARYLRPVQLRRPLTVPVWISSRLLQS
ncbi:hypothetical protein F511_33273 [Dorcoceras hygrometricum]|uniref:Uncharacterized protein n=1 Tax=Dorcoceras hygrometricum TaxID=472368 RepID=A0A2Z7CL99_9LAMI|nr:hypothetical protein F511_33273 [Dorcoceras hygrometricum]